MPGRRAALVGPSGAGKTTLLRAIAGLARVDAGTIRSATGALNGMPPHQRRIAVVFQEPRLLPHLDVLDNVALPLRAAGARQARAARARRARASTTSAWPVSRTVASRASPEASSSASRWPVPSAPNQICCSSTSLSPRWTPTAAASCGGSSASCSRSDGSRP